MSDENRHRVSLERTAKGQLIARNERGVTLPVGMADGDNFTPVELLLVAIAGCTAIDVDLITGKRSEPEVFALDAAGTKVRDSHGNHLVDLAVDFRVRFPDTDAGRAAEGVLVSAIGASHDRLCTVSRTVEVASPVTVSLRGEPLAAGHPSSGAPRAATR